MTHNNISYKEKFENQATCNNTKVVQCNLMQYQEKKNIYISCHSYWHFNARNFTPYFHSKDPHGLNFYAKLMIKWLQCQPKYR